jgi:acyl carrier protein
VRVTMILEDRYHIVVDLDELPNMTRIRDLALIVPDQSLSAA